MSSLLIEGPSRICGEVRIGGNKNAVLPMIAAAMLTEEPVILHNVPDILDVRNMLELARVLGAEVKRDGKSVEIFYDIATKSLKWYYAGESVDTAQTLITVDELTTVIFLISFALLP